MSATSKPYGFQVVCQLAEKGAKKAGNAVWIFGYRNTTESGARRSALLRKTVAAVLKVEPVQTQAEFERAYGIPQRM